VARIVLGDHHVLFLDALSTVLREHGHEVAAIAHSTSEMIALIRREEPALCLIDRHGTAIDADSRAIIQVIGQVLATGSSTRVLVLGAEPASEAARRALDAGASGYLHHSRGIGELTRAIERVLGGEVVTAIPQHAPSPRPAAPGLELRRAADLTSRERQCLMMLVAGLDTVAITRHLEISRTTARTHLQSVLTKLGVHSRLEAVSFAIRHRLPDLWSEARFADVPGPVLPPRQRQPAESELVRTATILPVRGLAARLASRFLRSGAAAAGRCRRPAGAWQA
jgi:two-component system nitrate/nitrite response regulator NarL